VVITPCVELNEAQREAIDQILASRHAAGLPVERTEIDLMDTGDRRRSGIVGARPVLGPRSSPNACPADYAVSDLAATIAAVRADGCQRNLRCPAHRDGKASLSVGLGTDSRVLVTCHAGCSTEDVLGAARLTWAAIMPPTEKRDPSTHRRIAATYQHRNERGELKFESVRFDPKKFLLRRPDGGGGWSWNLDGIRRIPYALDRLASCTPDVFLVEGHKDAEALWARAIAATTSPQGAADWRDSYADDLIRAAGVKRVNIVPDHDRAGWMYAERAAASFHARGVEVRILKLSGLHEGEPAAKHGRDISDWISEGHTIDELHGAIAHAPIWTTSTPPLDPATAAGLSRADAERERRITEVMERERIKRDAHRRLDAEECGPRTPPEVLTLRERLTRPRDDVAFRIDRWLPRDGRGVFAAQAKTGKTTIVHNLIRCLVDGDAFLGRDAVTPIDGAVVLVDLEMSRTQLERWLTAQAIRNDHRVLPIALRGQATAFNILNPDVRAEWARRFREHHVRYVVLDCLRPVLDALGLDEHHEAGRFLVAFDQLLADAGITEALIVHHMGHTGERARGDSRLRDWPDVEWRLVRQDEHPSSARFMTAYGRDVDVPEAQLHFNAATRRLTLVGGSRQHAASRAALPAVLSALQSAEAPLSVRQLQSVLAHSEHPRAAFRAAIKAGIHDGVIVTESGKCGAILHRLASEPAEVCQRAEVCRQCAGHGCRKCAAAIESGTLAHSARIRWPTKNLGATVRKKSKASAKASAGRE